MDKETAIEIIRLDAKIEQTTAIIRKIGNLPCLNAELEKLKKQKYDYCSRF